MAAAEPDPPSAPESRQHRSDRSAGRSAQPASSVGRKGETWRGVDRSLAIVGELLAGLFVWGGIGWLVGTRIGGHPWPFVVGSLLGFAASFYLVWMRAEGRITRRSPPRTGGSDRAGPTGGSESP